MFAFFGASFDDFFFLFFSFNLFLFRSISFSLLFFFTRMLRLCMYECVVGADACAGAKILLNADCCCFCCCCCYMPVSNHSIALLIMSRLPIYNCTGAFKRQFTLYSYTLLIIICSILSSPICIELQTYRKLNSSSSSSSY